MTRLHLLFFCTVIFLLASCSLGNKNKFTVTGSINNMPVQEVVLEEIGVNNVITVLDSTRSTEGGRFEVSAIAPEPGLYRIRFPQQKFILLAIDKGDVKVTADWSQLGNWQVTGSPGSESLRKFYTSLMEFMRDVQTMNLVKDSLKKRGNDSLLAVAAKQSQLIGDKFTQYIEHYADTTKFLPVAVFAVRMLNLSGEKTFLDVFTQNLDHRFPNTKMAKDFVSVYNQLQKQPGRMPPSASPQVGRMAPEISLPDANGKNIALSSLKGKYVLLDFWASWCQPCRLENPNVVAAYNKFKDKNFTVYSVSLDNNKEKWQEAIVKDGLSWPSHVSDFNSWESPTVKGYNIESIPSNFLLDPTGKIIDANLRGEELLQKLAQLLK